MSHTFSTQTVEPEVMAKGVVGAVEGKSVTLICNVRAYPKAMVEWMRYGMCQSVPMPIRTIYQYLNCSFISDAPVRSKYGAWKVNETELSIFSKSKILKIFKADRQQMGNYICKASNSIGAAETQVQLYRK